MARGYRVAERDWVHPMVESKSKRRGSPWQIKLVIRRALDSGMPGEDILYMVQTEVNGNKTFHEPRLAGFESYDEDTVFTELPDGLIDIPTAAKKHGINPSTLRTWIQKGYITVVGRLRAPARGGGYSVVDEQKLLEYAQNPVRRGRPIKL